MEIGKVERYIHSIVESGKGVFMALIDPDKQTPEKAGELAKAMAEGGADIILLGGSIGAQGNAVDQTSKLIKESVSIPLHIFPGNVGSITESADSIYFMSLLNSENPYWISQAQTMGAPMVKKYSLEPIPTAYLIFEPGQTVGWVGDAHLLPRNNPDLAIAYSLAGQFMGMRFVILESGSGAPGHVPLEIVKAVRENTDLKISVAGGVKTPEQARQLVKFGANCIHIGTMIENSEKPQEIARKFARAIHLED